MTHQSKISSSIEIAHEPTVKQHLSLPLALAILALGLMVGVFATQLSTAENNNEVNRQRAIEAEAARYSSLGMFYAAGNNAQAEGAIEAEAARYSGLAEFYLPENAANGQRAIEAEAARYSGLAEFYLTENLAWPPRPTQFYPAEKLIVPVIGDAMAVYHQSEWSRTPSTVLPIVENKDGVNRDIGLMEFFTIPDETNQQRTEPGKIEALPNIDPADRKFFSPGYRAISGVSKEAEGLPTTGTEPQLLAWPPRPTQFRMANNAVTSPDEPALAAYHQSEWGRMPNATLPVGENTLAAYHQSEWGRPLNTVLPIAKHETDADQDLGLMEFSPGVNEAGMHRHAREYGLARFSNLLEIDADQDVGLMAFFTVPDETSRQYTEPGTLEALPTIDPADRKFFSPGYGAPTTSAKRSEAVLPPMENKIGKWSATWFLLK